MFTRRSKSPPPDKYTREGSKIRRFLFNNTYDRCPMEKIKELVQKIQIKANEYFEKSINFAQYIEDPKVKKDFLEFVKSQKELPIEMYVDEETDPFLALRLYIDLHIRRKTKKTAAEILKTYIKRVLVHCETRGHCLSKGFEFHYRLKEKIEGLPQVGDYYQTFTKEKIFELKPTPMEHLAIYVMDAFVDINLKRGGWSCG